MPDGRGSIVRRRTEIHVTGFAGRSSCSQVNVLNSGVGTFVREFDFLGVEGEHVLEFAPVRQAQVHPQQWIVHEMGDVEGLVHKTTGPVTGVAST